MATIFCLSIAALAEANFPTANHVIGNSTSTSLSYSITNNSNASNRNISIYSNINLHSNISAHSNKSIYVDEPEKIIKADTSSSTLSNSSQNNGTLTSGVFEKAEPAAKSGVTTRRIVKSSDNLSHENNTTVLSNKSELNITSPNNPKNAEVATYVYNDDDDSLDVSLYIDSVPKGKATVSKGEQQTLGNFTLPLGFHRFKIVWQDPSPKKVYESEQDEEIKGDDAVTLYTTEHRELEKYDLTVSVKNENDKKLTAYLYVDGLYQNDKEISESSTEDFSSVSVEEGTHDISLKWLDPYSNDEYEKKKRITVEGEANIIFVASKGTSFEDKGESTNKADDPSPVNASYLDHTESTGSTGTVNGSTLEADKGLGTIPRDNNASGYYGSSDSINNSITNNSATGGTENNLTDSGTGVISPNSTAADAVTDNNSRSTAENADKNGDRYAIQTLSAKESPVAENKKLKDVSWEDISIVYPLVLLAAIYFVFRH